MKKGLLSFLMAVTLFSAFAQKNCEGFGQFRKGLKSELTSYDKNDKVVSVVNQEVINLETIGGELVATSNVTTTSDRKGKSMPESFSTKIRCKDGNIYMNFSDFTGMNAMPKMEGSEMKITGDDLMYPYALSAGQTFPDAKTTVEMLMKGTPIMKMSFTMKNRKVAAIEKVTSPAGTWECYKITYDMENSISSMGNSSGAIWFSDGIMIKTESYSKKGEKTHTTLITKLVK